MKKCLSICLFLSLLSVTLQACVPQKNNNSSSTKASKNMNGDSFAQKALEIQNRNANEDALQAIAAGDRRLYARAARGISIPGVSSATYKLIKNNCGLRYQEGFGDVLRGNEHRNYQKVFKAYAEKYNSVIVNSCK